MTPLLEVSRLTKEFTRKRGLFGEASTIRAVDEVSFSRSCRSISRLITCACTETSSADTGSSAITSDGLSASASASRARSR